MSATPSEVPDLNAADQTDASPQLSPEIPRRFILLDFDVVRAYGLSPQAGWLYACLKSYADYETGTAFPAKETLASLLQLTQGRSIDKYIAELGDRGLITEVHRRYCNPADKRDWVLDQPDHVHTAQTSNLYVVNMRPESAQVRGACGPAHPPGAAQRTGGVRPSAHEQEPLNNTHSPSTPKTSEKTTSVHAVAPTGNLVDMSIADKHRNGERTPQPRPLHPDWTPNNANRATAAELGVHLDYSAHLFRQAMSAGGQHRRCWGSAFTKFLRTLADQTTFTFGVSDEALAAKAGDFALASIRATRSAPPAEDPALTDDTAPDSGPRSFNSATPTENCTDRDTGEPRPQRCMRDVHLTTIMKLLDEAGIGGASVRDRAIALLDAGTSFFKIPDIIKEEASRGETIFSLTA